jgi:hypothetical protein
MRVIGQIQIRRLKRDVFIWDTGSNRKDRKGREVPDNKYSLRVLRETFLCFIVDAFLDQ